MPYIDLKNDKPGILGLFEYAPNLAKPMRELAEQLLRNSSLLQSQAELIAAYVSWGNNTPFCFHSHACAAMSYAEILGYDPTDEHHDPRPFIIDNSFINKVDANFKSLFMLSDDVRINVKPNQQSIDFCKHHGYSDQQIHDVIAITAAFCMFNRYVSGLDTIEAQPSEYVAMGKDMAENGYA